MWSRQGKNLTDRFRDVAAAAARMLPEGCVVDGELVALDSNGRLSFDLLQRRLVASPRTARRVLSATPSSYMAFDLLAVQRRGHPHPALDPAPGAVGVAGRVGAAVAAEPGHVRRGGGA